MKKWSNYTRLDEKISLVRPTTHLFSDILVPTFVPLVKPPLSLLGQLSTIDPGLTILLPPPFFTNLRLGSFVSVIDYLPYSLFHPSVPIRVTVTGLFRLLSSTVKDIPLLVPPF